MLDLKEELFVSFIIGRMIYLVILDVIIHSSTNDKVIYCSDSFFLIKTQLLSHPIIVNILDHKQ